MLEGQQFGTSASEVFGGRRGNDFMDLFAGDDAADAGAGNDVIDGGLGFNFLKRRCREGYVLLRRPRRWCHLDDDHRLGGRQTIQTTPRT